MRTAFDLMFPEGSSARALLADYASHPEDFNRFLETVPAEYRKLFLKQRVVTSTRPAVEAVTFMEVTGYFKKKANPKLAPFNFSVRLHTSDGTDFDLNTPDWSAISYVTTINRFKGWQNRVKPDAQTIEDMQALFDAGFSHVAPLINKAAGRSIEGGCYFAAHIEGKVVHEAMVILGDHALHVPATSFIYREDKGSFKNPEVFTRYRYSKLKTRPNWASTEEWKPAWNT